jgi:hypothetical protein
LISYCWKKPLSEMELGIDCKKTYRVSIYSGYANKHTGKSQFGRPWYREIFELVDKTEEGFELVLFEDERVYCPVTRHIIHFDYHARHNGEVMASPLQCPEEVRILAARGFRSGAIGKNELGRDEVVERIAVLVLED